MGVRAGQSIHCGRKTEFAQEQSLLLHKFKLQKTVEQPKVSFYIQLSFILSGKKMKNKQRIKTQEL